MSNSKQDLKNIIRPLIKECVKEVILESGVLSKIITEVVTGLKGSLVVESKQTRAKVQESEPETPTRVKSAEEQLAEKKAREELIREKQDRAQKMMAATGMSKIFSDIPLPAELAPEPIREPVRARDPEPLIEREREPEVPLTEEERRELMEAKRKRKEEESADAKLGARGGMALRGMDPSDPGISIKGILNVIGGKSTWLNQLKK